MSRKLRSLLFSTLYPSSTRPGHGIFVETRLRELLRSGEIDTKVVAPVPWMPAFASRSERYGAIAGTPQREQRNGIDVLHPRYPLVPKLGMNLAPIGLALGARSAVRQLLREGFDFDVIDAHYFYPDGVAAALLARWFGKPFTITARGSDLNLIARYPLPRVMMQRAAHSAQASIGVCAALVDVLRTWNIEPKRLHVIRNGVDLDRFCLRPMHSCRQALGVRGDPILLSVGNLVELKGHDLVINALHQLRKTYPNAKLVVVGAGPLREQLERQAQSLRLSDCVRFVGAVPQAMLADWYGAADVLVLASSREGWANVLLESLACGTPVVATRVGGTPEVMTDPVAGRLVDERSASAIAGALRGLLPNLPARASVRRFAERFDWTDTSQAQLDLFTVIARLPLADSHA